MNNISNIGTTRNISHGGGKKHLRVEVYESVSDLIWLSVVAEWTVKKWFTGRCLWCPSLLWSLLRKLFLLLLTDEGALVRAARKLGFIFSGRTPDSVIVTSVSVIPPWKDEAASHPLLQINAPFSMDTSSRKLRFSHLSIASLQYLFI